MIFSVVLGSLSLFGLWMMGNKWEVAWPYGAGLQILWAVYAVTIGQFGLLIMPPFYFMMYVRGWRKSRSGNESG